MYIYKYTHTHTHILYALYYCPNTTGITQLQACMEDATYTETGYIVFVIHCELLGSGLYNIAPSHLLCNCTGLVKIK
jgi:hypothetical protein